MGSSFYSFICALSLPNSSLSQTLACSSCEVNSYELWSSRYEGTSCWEGVCRFYSGRWLPPAFHLLPSHTPVDEQECLLTHARTHTLNTYPLPLSLLYAHIQRHYTNALTNTNRFHLSVIWADMFTLLLIWMSLHCLASFAILKIHSYRCQSYKQMVANLLGSHSGHVKAAFFFSLGLFWSL